MNAKTAPLNPALKLALDIGPLLLFFIAYFRPAPFLPLVGPLLPAALARLAALQQAFVGEPR